MYAENHTRKYYENEEHTKWIQNDPLRDCARIKGCKSEKATLNFLD